MTDSNVQTPTDSTYNLFPVSPCFKFLEQLNILVSSHVNYQGFQHCNICFPDEIWGKCTDTFLNVCHFSTAPSQYHCFQV